MDSMTLAQDFVPVMNATTTLHLQWADPKHVLKKLIESLVDVQDNLDFEWLTGFKIILCTLIAFAYALYILAYPPKHRKLSILILAIPLTYAFLRHPDLTPNAAVCDTFGRFIYIWFAHMSHEVVILEFSPSLTKENVGWKSRVRSAYKVLFARTHDSRGPRHTYSRSSFVLCHVAKATILYAAQVLYHIVRASYISAPYMHGADKAVFFRRLPASLNGAEMFARFEHFVYWCVLNMYLYEAFHSVFAVLFVACGFDAPGEWSMSLFGPCCEAYSVRRYWGKHWHNYIYESFSSHTKIATRGWLRMERGTLLTRLVENTAVFAASGIMHSAVQWVQNPSSTEHWCIAVWYVGQMVPIVVEDAVQGVWRRKKKEIGIKDSMWLGCVERAVGYAWVVGFNMWSIPKYVHIKHARAEAGMRVKYAKQLVEWERKQAILSEGEGMD
jgi:hypothetical protein